MIWYRFLILILLFGAIGCGDDRDKVVEKDDQKTEEISLESALLGHLMAFTTGDQYRNHKNVDQLNKISAYIREQFEGIGLTCSYEVVHGQYRNVICRTGITRDQKMVIGAHYDVCGDQDGADDNGSGVAGLIEVARLIYPKREQLQHEIEFVAYTLEEPPYFGTEQMGSYVHAKGVHDRGEQIAGMVCLEMIGYFGDFEQRYPDGIPEGYPEEGDFIAAITNSQSEWMGRWFQAGMAGEALNVEALAVPSSITGVDFSDHRNYWKFGYDAMMITDTAFYRNRNYHKITDTIDTLDFKKMAMVVRGVGAMLLRKIEE